MTQKSSKRTIFRGTLELGRVILRIRPRSVYFLRFILEGYDNLFLMSTRDPRLGIVEIRYVPSAKETLREILKFHHADLGISRLDPEFSCERS